MNNKINIHILGDSHSRKLFSDKFESWEESKPHETLNYLQNDFHFTTSSVPGATAHSILKNKSKTNAHYWFVKSLDTYGNKDYIGLLIGEIDCNFLIWKKTDIKNQTIDKCLNETILRYRKFVENYMIAKHSSHKIILIGVTLPSIHDPNQHFDVGKDLVRNFEGGFIPDIKSRTELTILFNKKIKEIATDLKCNYLDITDQTLDKKAGTIHEEYTHGLNVDNHLPIMKTYKFWIEEFRKIVE